ncbi:hypothetical protein KAR91_44110 [Candidatus Pacearchaeota archaeon]|nr:hypothetical protein [Candidatus Pacearchaeota archaeon]
MIAKNVTRQEMEKALAMVNKKYEDNITWNREPELKGGQYHFTLYTHSVEKPGHRLGWPDYSGQGNGNQRRLRSACWHVHGNFFDALLNINPNAVIKSAHATIDINGGNWQDKNMGSQMYPFYFSEACMCQ